MNEFAFMILNALVPVLVTLLAYYSTRYINILKNKEELSNAILVANMVVKAVEQVYRDIPNEEKKEKALLLIERMGVTMSLAQLEVLIESAVTELKQNKG